MTEAPDSPEAPEVPVIAVDGPSGVGKGTLAWALVRRLHWHYLESGALYRALGHLAERRGVALDDARGLAQLAAGLELVFADGAVWLDGEPLGDSIRTEAAGRRASQIAPLPAVRAALLRWQRRCARAPGLVADGRDMGSVVFPQAACKIFLTASAEARAMRRFKQLREKGFDVNIARLLRDIRERDSRDSKRSVSPLKRAGDAFELDTTGLSADEAAAVVFKRVEQTWPWLKRG